MKSDNALDVLHVIHSLDLRSGGPSHAIRDLVRAQHAAGLRPAVLATNAQAAKVWDADAQFRESVVSEELFQRVPVKLVGSLGKSRPWSRYSWSPQAARQLRGRLSGSQAPRIVHIHGVFSHITQKAAQLAAGKSIPYIIRPAGALDLDCLERGSARLKRLFIRTLLRKAIAGAAFVHVTSEKEVASIRAQFPSARTEILPHGTSKEQSTGGRFRELVPSLGDHEYILCLSRIHPIKRLDLAIRAFDSMTRDFPNLRLVIAGNDAGALENLKSLVGELNLQDRCFFTGFVVGPDKAHAYSNARALLHTSDHENFGLSVVEAMAYGCPVVTTQGVAAGVYVAEARAGSVVPSDVGAIAAALREVLRVSRDELGRRGADFVQQNLTWPRITDRLSELYRRAITDSPTR